MSCCNIVWNTWPTYSYILRFGIYGLNCPFMTLNYLELTQGDSSCRWWGCSWFGRYFVMKQSITNKKNVDENLGDHHGCKFWPMSFRHSASILDISLITTSTWDDAVSLCHYRWALDDLGNNSIDLCKPLVWPTFSIGQSFPVFCQRWKFLLTFGRQDQWVSSLLPHSPSPSESMSKTYSRWSLPSAVFLWGSCSSCLKMYLYKIMDWVPTPHRHVLRHSRQMKRQGHNTIRSI